MLKEHKGDASKTTEKRNRATQDGPIGGVHTGDDRKAAVIGRSKCTVARKFEQGTSPDGGFAMQGWGASAAPLPDIPLSVVDELPLPLLDCGQGKKYATTGTDDSKRRRDERIQTGMLGNEEQWDKPRRKAEEMTANKDCIPASDTPRPPNSVDLP